MLQFLRFKTIVTILIFPFITLIMYVLPSSPKSQTFQPYQSSENRKIENPRLRKGLDAITSSFNHISGTLGNAFEVKSSDYVLEIVVFVFIYELQETFLMLFII